MSKKVVIVEPFYSGSHKRWTDGLSKLYRQFGHEVHLLTLPGRHWKWRMQGAALFLAERFQELNVKTDVLIASDMLDLSVFAGHARTNLIDTKLVAYFHENQLTYPWSPTDQDTNLNRDQSYGLINLRTALSADEVYFNSAYHLSSFLSAIPPFVKQFPDGVNTYWKTQIENKSKVLHLAMDLKGIDKNNSLTKPVLLWNHRWEYDKNPKTFYNAISRLKEEEVEFGLIVCGERTNKYPGVFDRIKEEFEEELIHFGFAESREDYGKLLNMANILPVTSNQDFFGVSVVEGLAAGCVPVLPNRLSYSEHLPKDLKGYLVRDEQAWYELLKDVTLNLEIHQRKCASLSDFVKRYDWTCLSDNYLDILN